MLFGILMWIIISCIPLQTTPEFVVREIEACCHHRITLSCGTTGVERDMRIMVVQARYVIDQQEEIPAVPSSQPLFPFPSPTEKQFQSQDSSVSPLSSAELDNHLPAKEKQSKTISLWDLDIKWMHDLANENLPHPIHVNAPSWHPSHYSTYQGKKPFLLPYPRKYTPPPKFPKDGLNFSSSRVIEMPPYQMDFLDKNTIWREPLFLVGPTQSSILTTAATPTLISTRSSSVFGSTFKNLAAGESTTMQASGKTSSRESRSDTFASYYNLNHLNDGGECWSYQALSSTSATFTTDPNRVKPPWHFKDLRAYFNQRCSGRNKCTVELLRGKQPDPDVSKLCHLLPEGKITVKYLCYNASSDYVHSRCNVDVTPAKEGFLHNPGYPDLYPGDQPCQWRLHVPQQKILLVFFDISLRGQEKLVCRDELVASEEHSKLLSTCGDHSSAVAILSESHRLNVTLIPQSRLAFPKRGFLIYYRVLGCRDPVRPANSYIAFRNATHAYILCDLGHLYPDTLARDRWLFCNPLEDTWAGQISHCQDVRGYNAVKGNLSIAQVFLKNPSFWPVGNTRYISRDDVITDYILPICVMLALFAINGVVLFFIWRQRQRLEEMENERNQEMEEICAAAVADDSNTPVDESTFSFPSSAVEDLWHDDHNFDEDIDETDQDRTLTTLTLHTTSSPPDSAMATMRHYLSNTGDSGHNQSNGNGGYYRFSQEGSGIFTSNGHGHSTFSTFGFHQPPPPPPLTLPLQQQQQQHPLPLQPRFGSNQHNGLSSSYMLSNNSAQLHNGSSNSHHGANGAVMGNGNGSFTTTFYTGYSRTTAV